MIIQCPKCQTKFSVSSELISELELPRFHCSRCDNVFDLDPRMPASFEDGDVPKTTAEAPTQTRHVSAELTQTIEAPMLSEKLNSTTLEMSRDELKKITSTINSEPEKTAKGLEIPKSYSPASPATAPIESLLEEGPPAIKPDPFTDPFVAYQQQSKFEPKLDLKVEPPKTEQLSMDLTAGDYPEKTPDEGMPYGISYGDPMTDDTESGPVKATASVNFTLPEETNNKASPVRSPIAGIGLLLMPIIFSLVSATAIGIYLLKSPWLAEAVASNLGFSLPKLAPPGMYTDGVRYKKIILDSGENIHAIVGKLKNDSLQKYKNVIIEGFVFDKAGQVVESAKVSVANGLNDTRIKSMTPEMIFAMQTEKAPKKFELSPNQTQDFLVVLNKDGKTDLSKAQFYSARIRSVIE